MEGVYRNARMTMANPSSGGYHPATKLAGARAPAVEGDVAPYMHRFGREYKNIKIKRQNREKRIEGGKG